MTAMKKRWGSGARVDDLETGKKILLRAAVECFTTRGIKATTIEDIAKEANVTRRTVYRYFNGKTDIIHALIAMERDRMFYKLGKHLDELGGEFPDLLEEAMWYAATYLPPEDGRADLVSGINASEASPFMYTAESEHLWYRLLDKPLQRYNQEQGKSLNVEDLVSVICRIVLSYRQYPTSREQFSSALKALQL